MGWLVQVVLAGFPDRTDTWLVISGVHSVAMARLFDRRDIEFLRALPGCTRRTEAEFRRRRCDILLGYLRSMLADDSPSSWTLCHRVRFAAAMVPACGRMLCYRWDLRTVELDDVVRRFERIVADMRHWIPQVE